jgi:hypothetical protein
MRSKDILKEALRLEPAEKFLIVEWLLKSLDEPDHNLDELWMGEAESRLAAYSTQSGQSFHSKADSDST